MDNIDDRIAKLTARVWRLEETLRSHGIALQEEQSQTEATRTADREATAPEAIHAAPTVIPSAAKDEATLPFATSSDPTIFQFEEEAESSTFFGGLKGDHSLESRIASQWFNRIGILAVLIAAAWFLKLAFENHWIGPSGRVLIGLVSGGALVAWSERFRLKGFAAFSYSLKAVGTGVLYLSLWASFGLYHLMPSGVVFVAMIAVTATNAYLAWAQDAELLAVYAIAGALSTPALLSTGENHEISLFLYLLILDLSILVLAMLKPWSRLVVAAFLGTVVYFMGWSFRFYNTELVAPTTIFLGLFFLLFALAPRLVLDHSEREPMRALWDQLVGTALPIANAIFGFVGCLALFSGPGYENSSPWIAVFFAAFYLLLLNLPSKGRFKETPPLLNALHLVAAVTFLTIAIPLKAHGRWLTIGWLAEATALFWIENKLRSRLLQALATICLSLGLLSTVVQNKLVLATPIFNPRFGCYLAAIICLVVVAWLSLTNPEEEDSIDRIGGKVIAAAAALIINLLILLAVGWEIDSYWWIRSWKGDQSLLSTFEMYAQFSYSAFFMAFGSILLAIGFWKRSAFFRWQALVLLAITIAKVFLWDISTLSQGYRIVSFLGLGALLLGISFVYQRDLLKLRKEKA